MIDNAEAETVTWFLDKVSSNRVVQVVVVRRLVAQYHKSDDGRSLTEQADGIFMTNSIQTFSTNLHTHTFVHCVWLAGVVVRTLDMRLTRRRFKSRS